MSSDIKYSPPNEMPPAPIHRVLVGQKPGDRWKQGVGTSYGYQARTSPAPRCLLITIATKKVHMLDVKQKLKKAAGKQRSLRSRMWRGKPKSRLCLPFMS